MIRNGFNSIFEYFRQVIPEQNKESVPSSVSDDSDSLNFRIFSENGKSFGGNLYLAQKRERSIDAEPNTKSSNNPHTAAKEESKFEKLLNLHSSSRSKKYEIYKVKFSNTERERMSSKFENLFTIMSRTAITSSNTQVIAITRKEDFSVFVWISINRRTK